MGVFDKLNSGQPSSTTGGGVFDRLKSNFQQDQLNQELIDKQQMDQASEISDSMPPLQKSEPFLARIQKDIYDNTLGPLTDKVMRFATSAVDTLTPGNAREMVKQNPYAAPIFGEALEPPKTTADTIADVAGSLYGATPAIMGAYATGGAGAAGVFAKIAPNAPKLVSGLVRGIGAGAAYGTAEEALQAAQGEEQSIGGRLADVGKTAALFGAGDAALGIFGKGIQAARGAAAKDLMQAPQKQTIDSAANDFTKRIESNTNTAIPISESPSYSGVNLLSKVDQPLPSIEPVNAETMKGNWFTNLFGNQGLGISPVNSSKRISEGPLTTADQLVKSGIKTDVQGVKGAVSAQMRATYQNFVDALSPLKRISNTTYETAMDAARGNNIANTIVRDKFVTPEGNVVGAGLSDIFKKVARGQDKQFIDYLTLRHAETRVGRGERVYADNLGMTPDKIQARVQMYNQRHPGFESIAKEWDQFNNNVLQHYGVNEGLISQDLYNALREKNPNYSPMRRQFSLSEKPGMRFKQAVSNSSFSGQKAPLKEVSPTGSVRDIVDPRKTTIESVGAWANAAMRNRTMQSIVDAVKRDPESFKGVIEIKPVTEEATQSSLKDMNKLIDEHGVEGMLESLNKDFELLFKKSPNQGLNQENVVRAMVKGQPVHLQVHDPELVKTLVGMGPQNSNVLIDVLRSFSNATKRGATGMLAPVFAVKGATMDLVQSAIQAKNPVKQAGYTVYSIFSGIGDKLGIPGLKSLAEEYRRAGGEYSAALKGDRKLNRSISGMTRDPLLSPLGIGKAAVNTVKAPFKALESIGNIAENAPRMAAYKIELNRLGGEKTSENVRQAMSQARESTINYSRKGALSSDIESLVPYNNAAVQGTYRIMSAFKNNPVRTVAAVATLSVLPKLAEYAQFHDDPDYLKLPARERMRFLFVNKNQDGTFTKIPMDPSYNSIGEMTIEALRHFKDNDPTAFKDSMDALANAWLPPVVTGAAQGITQGGGLDKSIAGALNSTIAAPFVATTANQSFTGAPIVSRAVADRSPQNQYDEKTSNIARKFGAITGMSPMKVDYLIRAYGGDPARLLLPLNSPVGSGNTRNTLLKNFIVDPQLTNTLTNDYYGGKQKLDQAYRDNKEVYAPLPPWFSEQLHKELASQANGSINKKLADLTAQKKLITTDQRLTPAQRTASLREIQSNMNDLYMDINSKLYKQGVPIK